MIAHVDADAFFASVIIRSHPSLRGKPLLALGMGGGCVIAATYEAKAKGVKTGMRVLEARLLCPGAIEMEADFRETALASRQIEETILSHCPIIEQMSVDEWFLDLKSLIGGVPSDLAPWGRTMQSAILRQTGLSVSIGIAPSKTLAKMAGEYRKPAGVTVLHMHDHPLEMPCDIRHSIFLSDRPVASIPGIGKRREPQALSQGWRTAWDFANANPGTVRTLFGKPGIDLQQELQGVPVSAVEKDNRPPQSISRCRSFRATADTAFIRAHLLKHLEYCVMKMRRWHLGCAEISVWLRGADMEHRGERCKLPRAENTVDSMLRPVIDLLTSLMHPSGKRSTQVGLALLSLRPLQGKQHSLFQDPTVDLEEEKLQEALDRLHERFGRNSITHGSALPVKSGTSNALNVPIIQ